MKTNGFIIVKKEILDSELLKDYSLLGLKVIIDTLVIGTGKDIGTMVINYKKFRNIINLTLPSTTKKLNKLKELGFIDWKKIDKDIIYINSIYWVKDQYPLLKDNNNSHLQMKETLLNREERERRDLIYRIEKVTTNGNIHVHRHILNSELPKNLKLLGVKTVLELLFQFTGEEKGELSMNYKRFKEIIRAKKDSIRNYLNNLQDLGYITWKKLDLNIIKIKSLFWNSEQTPPKWDKTIRKSESINSNRHEKIKSYQNNSEDKFSIDKDYKKLILTEEELNTLALFTHIEGETRYKESNKLTNKVFKILLKMYPSNNTKTAIKINDEIHKVNSILNSGALYEIATDRFDYK